MHSGSEATLGVETTSPFLDVHPALWSGSLGVYKVSVNPTDQASFLREQHLYTSPFPIGCFQLNMDVNRGVSVPPCPVATSK